MNMNTPQIPSIYNVQASEAQAEIQRGFITRVFAWMTFGLLVTAAVSFFAISVPGLMDAIFSNVIVFIGLIVGELVLVLVLSALVQRLSPVAASLLFTGYAALNGLTLSIVFLVYTGTSIAVTFGITACTFGIMTLFGYTTQRDLTKMGSLLIMALLGVILASVVNLFLANPAIDFIISGVGVLVFVGLTAYDTQKLKRLSLQLDNGGELTQKISITGALTLYLDFINLFLWMLRFTGRRR